MSDRSISNYDIVTLSHLLTVVRQGYFSLNLLHFLLGTCENLPFLAWIVLQKCFLDLESCPAIVFFRAKFRLIQFRRLLLDYFSVFHIVQILDNGIHPTQMRWNCYRGQQPGTNAPRQPLSCRHVECHSHCRKSSNSVLFIVLFICSYSFYVLITYRHIQKLPRYQVECWDYHQDRKLANEYGPFLCSISKR